MNTTQTLIKLLFAALCLALGITYFGGQNLTNTELGLAAGVGLAALLFIFSSVGKRISIRQLNTVALGIFFGALFGYALTFAVAQALSLMGAGPLAAVSTALIYLLALYLGVSITLQSENDLHLAIPLIRLDPTTQKKRDILLDLSILQDVRIIDFAQSGLLDQLVIIPRFLVRQLQETAEDADEKIFIKAKKTLEVINRLEMLPSLKLRYTDAHFGDKDGSMKMIQLARMLGADLLTADISRIEQASIEGVRIINIHSLSNALKPLTNTGEVLTIKVQRYGKEPRQGVGYLDDGTMVVINGGADYIGETIKTHVLSVKHTSSGRMIFCNALEDEDDIPYRTHDESESYERMRAPYTV